MNHCLFKAKDTKGAVGNTVDYSSLTNYLKIEPQIVIGNVILMSIVDYDYVLKEFVAKPYTGSIF